MFRDWWAVPTLQKTFDAARVTFSRPNAGESFMVATTFSQFTDTDTATSAAWQLTLTLMHVLWAGTAIVVFAAIVDRVIAQRRPTAT
jgi:uncharacterized membrane protein